MLHLANEVADWLSNVACQLKCNQYPAPASLSIGLGDAPPWPSVEAQEHVPHAEHSSGGSEAVVHCAVAGGAVPAPAAAWDPRECGMCGDLTSNATGMRCWGCSVLVGHLHSRSFA